MMVVYILIMACVIFLGGSAIYGFYWAAKNRQFQNLEESATVIFDKDEPLGEATDCFPGEKEASKYLESLKARGNRQ